MDEMIDSCTLSLLTGVSVAFSCVDSFFTHLPCIKTPQILL